MFAPQMPISPMQQALLNQQLPSGGAVGAAATQIPSGWLSPPPGRVGVTDPQVFAPPSMGSRTGAGWFPVGGTGGFTGRGYEWHNADGLISDPPPDAPPYPGGSPVLSGPGQQPFTPGSVGDPTSDQMMPIQDALTQMHTPPPAVAGTPNQPEAPSAGPASQPTPPISGSAGSGTSGGGVIGSMVPGFMVGRGGSTAAASPGDALAIQWNNQPAPEQTLDAFNAQGGAQIHTSNPYGSDAMALPWGGQAPQLDPMQQALLNRKPASDAMAIPYDQNPKNLVGQQ